MLALVKAQNENTFEVIVPLGVGTMKYTAGGLQKGHLYQCTLQGKERLRASSVSRVECTISEWIKSNMTTLIDEVGSYLAIDKVAIDAYQLLLESLLDHSDFSPIASDDGYTAIGDIYVPIKDYQALSTCSKTGLPTLILGPSGAGKTSLARAYAKQNSLSYVRVNCASVRDPEEWVGYREAVSGSTKFIPSQFADAYTKGNAVIVLDEINRLESWLTNTLLPLLDDDQSTSVHNQVIERGANVTLIATANIGSRFVGTFSIDSALINRFGITVLMDYLPEAKEISLLIEREGIRSSVANEIVKKLHVLRVEVDKQEINTDVSTRSALKIAKLAKHSSLSVNDLITYVVLNGISDKTTVKDLIDLINAYDAKEA